MNKCVLHHRFVVKKVCKKKYFNLCGRRKFLFYFVFSGWIWSKNTLTADHWLLDVKLRVTGRGRVGADGMVRE